MKCERGCVNCRFYVSADEGVRCEWFECKISKMFPRWIEDFRMGRLRFCSCGFFEGRSQSPNTAV